MTVTETRVTVYPEKRKEFFQSLNPLVSQIREENGCLLFHLYSEMGNENSLVMIGEWKSEDSWEDHRKGNNFAVLLGLIKILTVQKKLDFKLLLQVGDLAKATEH